MRINIKQDTQQTENLYYQIWEYCNRRLFGDRLPQAQIGFKALPKSLCQYQAQIIDHASGQKLDRININARQVASASFAMIVVAFIDAMISQEQQHFGTPGRGNYRNQERANLSKKIGLIPSSTSEEGGRETGEGIGYFYARDSLIDQVIRELINYGFDHTWQEITPAPNHRSGGKRYKYICPVEGCIENALSGKNAKLDCHYHKTLMQISS